LKSVHGEHLGLTRLEAWFALQGWEPHAFQREAWGAFLAGKSGLIHVPTGAGKTYAAYGGVLAEMLGEDGTREGEKAAHWRSGRGAHQRREENRRRSSLPLSQSRQEQGTLQEGVKGIRVIYVTPLRAVSRDIELALKRPVVELGVRARVESRTGDTSSSVRARQKEALPEVLVTTPESLTLMMTWEDARERFSTLRCVIVDEWHELLSTKRGTQTELALARLRGFAPEMRTWALSATLENLGEAARAVTGTAASDKDAHWHSGTAAHEDGVEKASSLPRSEQRSRAPKEMRSGSSLPRAQSGTEQGTRGGGEGTKGSRHRGIEEGNEERPRPESEEEEIRKPYIISARLERPVTIRTVIPSRPGAFPWAGHLGLSILPEVIASLDPARATLLFTNTRSQAELWHQALLAAKPEWAAITGLHHGSVDRAERERVEAGLKDGSVRLVVATSSLDLGVDFAPVEEVYQIGSPKGIARILQRAGRSGHRPGAPCRVTCVPTHGLELIEIDAVRRAVATGRIEPRTVVNKPLDVLAQHLVSCGLGGGFEPDAMYEEVRSAYSYRELTREEFDWTLKLVAEGGGNAVGVSRVSQAGGGGGEAAGFEREDRADAQAEHRDDRERRDDERFDGGGEAAGEHRGAFHQLSPAGGCIFVRGARA
jgi:ATP-dependent Lhr-like helicase